MSLVILLLFVIFLPLMMLGEVGAVIGGVSLVLGLFLTVLFFSTVEAVNRASLFYYAKTGQSPPMAQKHGLSF
jgi:ABC-type nickel/cobalt efflux system permease component RcnA